MTTKTIKIKDGMIALPKEIKKSWENSKVFLECFDDSLIVKKIYSPKISFKEMAKEFRKAFKGVTKKDISKTLKEIRNVKLSE